MTTFGRDPVSCDVRDEARTQTSRRAALLECFWRGKFRLLSGLRQLSSEEFDIMQRAWLDLSPDTSLLSFAEEALRTKSLNASVALHFISDGEREKLARGDSKPSPPSHLQRKVVRLDGAEHLRRGEPDSPGALILAWHNGAQSHTFVPELLDACPELVVCCGIPEIFWIGSRPLVGLPLANSRTGLAKVIKLLGAGRTVLLHFDGVFGRRDLMRKVFGTGLYFSNGFFHAARAARCKVVPVTAHFGRDGIVSARIGRPLYDGPDLDRTTEEEALNRVLVYFADVHRRCSPGQIVLGGHLQLMTSRPSGDQTGV